MTIPQESDPVVLSLSKKKKIMKRRYGILEYESERMILGTENIYNNP